jgi:anti-sigma regulatory factor (Ser/Thr protein kinase)
MRLVLQLCLPADARFLPQTRKAIDGYLADVGTDAEQRSDVVLALDEACANAVRHAFPHGMTGTIDVRVDLTEDVVIVQVEDEGVGFDPFEVPLRESELEDQSGRGLRIIRELMSSVQVESPTRSGGTRVRMAKHLMSGGSGDVS